MLDQRVRPAVDLRRPWAIKVAVGLLAFLGVGALGGGMTMIADPSGGLIGMPAEWMERVPLLSDWLVPGVVLAVWFGLGSLLAAMGLLMLFRLPGLSRLERATRHHWSWSMTIALGATQMAWIGIEYLYLPAAIWLQPLMFGVGLALVVVMLLPSVR